jgi:uncharacterized protein (TIGR03067 family)
MKWRFFFSLLVLFIVAADRRKEDQTDKDRKKIQGTWAFVLIEEAGSKKSPRELKGMEDRFNWTFRSNQLVRNLGMEFVTGTFKLDAAKQPKAIDLCDYAGKGKTARGIYTFDGELLKISLGSPQGGDRPAAFDAPLQAGGAKFILKRHVVQYKDS